MSSVSNFSVDEIISIFPSLEAPLLIDEGTWHPTPQPAHHGFMFVNTQADVSQCVGIERQKKAFLARNAHQRKKKEALDRLKLPQPYRGCAPQRGEKEVENVHRNKTQIHPTHDNSMLPVRVSAVLSQNHADPFCAYPVPMSSAMHLYFHHYRFYVVPTAYPFNVDRMNTWWAERAVMSPALLHTKLRLAAGHKAALESRNGVSSVACQRSRRDCLQFRMNAIRTLNDILQDPVTAVAESTVLLVGSIVTIETINAEFAALQTHMKGLATLIDLAGGLDALEHMTLSSIYYAVTAYAALQNEPPIIPMSAKFRSEILQEPAIFHPRPDDYAIGFVIPPYIATLGSRFATSPWYTEVSPSLKSFLTTFTRLIQHFELGKAYPELVTHTDNDLFTVFQHDFLSATCDPTYKMNDLNPPLRYSLLIYLYVRVSHLQSLPIVRHMVETFKHILAPRIPYLLVIAPDLLLWMLVSGGLGSKGYNTHSWFVLHTAHVAQCLGLSDSHQARLLLGEFFYTDQPEDMGADLWTEEVVALSASICGDSPGF